MSHTYSSNRIHVIFSTKNREKILSEKLQPKLWTYMAGIAHHQNFAAMIVGGIEDHIHALLVLPPTLPLAKAVQYIKGSSSKWINDSSMISTHFAWQEGYGAFSVSASQTSEVMRYIREQRVHHEKTSLAEEFVAFLKKYGVDYDPAYVLG
jgi:putative transposase